MTNAGLTRDFPMLRRRRMMGLDVGTTVASLARSTGVDHLSRSGIVRSDIRRGFGKATAVAKGVGLTIRLNLVQASSGRPLSGLAVYLWHCDRDGRYSIYGDGLARENYLRGVQPTDGAGWASFTSIFPATYAGRWPHIHFEVFPSVEQATNNTFQLAASQLALPADVCRKVYATPGYESSRAHLAKASPENDEAFGDGYSLAMASVTGDVRRGFTASLAVRI